jgi:anthranilate synthase/aminodeoxychorismate synthase-like glutamine amidotransferase
VRLLLVDNYDSFTFNLAHLFGGVGADVDVIRNDDARLHDGVLASYDATVFGPGPGRPEDAGRMYPLLREAAASAHPVLGVCLGAQAIGDVFGGNVVHAPALMHGKTSEITHDGSGVFAGVASPFTATRYHSLCIAHDPFPADLRAIAASEDGVIQGVAHRTLPIWGVQFHPESILTPAGAQLARNFLAIARERGTAVTP